MTLKADIPSSFLPHPHTGPEESLAGTSFLWTRSEWRTRSPWDVHLLYFRLSCRSSDRDSGAQRGTNTWDSAPQGYSMNFPQVKCWMESKVLCQFCPLPRGGHCHSPQWSKGSDAFGEMGKACAGLSRVSSVSMCSSWLLTLQREEAGLGIEPDSKFRETLRSEFSSWSISPIIQLGSRLYSRTFLQFNIVTLNTCWKSLY